MFRDFKVEGRLDLSITEFIECKFRETNFNKTVRLYEIPNIWIPKQNITELVDTLEECKFTSHQMKYYFHAVSDEALIFFKKNSYGLHDCLIYYTSKFALELLLEIIERISDHTKKLHINWFSSKDGSYEEIIDASNYVTTDSIYPFVTGGVDKYVEDFLKSDASIIVLIGEPGTGKTNFIRNILYRMGKEVYLSYDENILKKDDIFISFVSDQNAGAFVIEDADLLLKSRKIGNETMSKLLNVGDGLIRLRDKKLIFSTNLESINDIDQAITRPGRCYDVLKFRKLTLAEANVVCEDYELENLTTEKQYSLAEIFNRKKRTVERKFGFV